MTLYCEYTTLDQLRGENTGRYLDMKTSDDAVLFDIIRSTSREIENAAGKRRFFPRIETHLFNAPQNQYGELMFDDDLLSVTAFTNGTGNAFTTSDYALYPLNVTPKYKVKVKQTASEQLSPDGAGNYEGAISVAGAWGWHDDYNGAWVDTGATLGANITTTTAGSFTATTGKIVKGDLIEIDTEWLYVSSVTVGTSDTVTVVRGVNGSTAAIHTSGAVIYRYAIPSAVNMLAVVASAAYYKLRANPVGDTVQIGDMAFSTPKDVAQYITRRLWANGLARVGIG